MAGTLWLVGTPIGNVEDVSDRARRVLGEADVVAAEDTRRTGSLLHRLGIEPRRLVSHFDANERARVPELLKLLREGGAVAVVTDGGMPAVSDPGYRLVAACVAEGIAVDVVPGPSAATAALVVSGLPTDRFVFEGFLPRSGSARRDRLASIAREARTVVLFESPKRVVATLRELARDGGERRVAVARELTKIHQEVVRGTLAEVADGLGERAELRGEVVVVLEGVRATPNPVDAVTLAGELVAGGARKRDAAREAASRTGVPAREIYAALVEGA